MVDDVVLNKSASIERCLTRVTEEYRDNEPPLDNDFTRQDALILNLLRACETAIDLAMHVVRIRGLGLPQSSRHAFELLAEADLIGHDVAQGMKRMVGFRNIAVHNYRELDLEILRSIVENHLDDFRRFTRLLLQDRSP
jgi:uncharacterized protein YutE (UPF0331/DUF86 family)